ncbi:MAG: glucosylceramidase [Prevotellaceae bacterium]|jgi:glucosylceramidase|nr:glucosylceramidase [Prevotellaceae bacterium]
MNITMKTYATFLLPALLASCGGSGGAGKDNGDKAKDTSGDVVVYLTSSDRTADFAKKSVNFSDKPNMSPTTVTLDPSVRHQTMDGFGAALTGSSCYNLLRMTPADRTKFLKETFSDADGSAGFSYIRVAIGCSDFSLSEYSCCDLKGIENFALQNEELNYVIPVLKEILAINPELKILGSPWTCPKWMKVNNLADRRPHDSWTSGHLNPDLRGDYAEYFVRWIKAMKAEGILIHAVTPQNEPLNRGNSASLFMGWDEQRDFVRDALGPAVRDAGLKTKIYAFDHNYNYDNMPEQVDYPVKIYNDPDAAAFLAGAAYHNYGGDKAELDDIRRKRPDKELIFTETSIGTWNDGRNLAARLTEDMRETGLGTVNGGCRAVIVWNLMLDSERGPNRAGGCQTCYGAADISRNDYKSISRNSHYYVIAHLASVVKPGAARIGASGYSAAGITYSAFENTDGTYAFVLLNETEENKRITLSDGTHHFAFDVPRKSVASYRWKK